MAASTSVPHAEKRWRREKKDGGESTIAAECCTCATGRRAIPSCAGRTQVVQCRLPSCRRTEASLDFGGLGGAGPGALGRGGTTMWGWGPQSPHPHMVVFSHVALFRQSWRSSSTLVAIGPSPAPAEAGKARRLQAPRLPLPRTRCRRRSGNTPKRMSWSRPRGAGRATQLAGERQPFLGLAFSRLGDHRHERDLSPARNAGRAGAPPRRRSLRHLPRHRLDPGPAAASLGRSGRDRCQRRLPPPGFRSRPSGGAAGRRKALAVEAKRTMARGAREIDVKAAAAAPGAAVPQPSRM